MKQTIELAKCSERNASVFYIVLQIKMPISPKVLYGHMSMPSLLSLFSCRG